MNINRKKTTNVAIIGVGLIGGSLGMALRSCKGGAYHVVGLGRNEKKLKLAVKNGAIDGFSLNWVEGVRGADIVVVCTPVDIIAEVVKRILPGLKPGAIITDAGSVKGTVLKEVKKVIPRSSITGSPVFVGGHPLAGAEKSGVEFAKLNLYKNAVVVICYDAGVPAAAVRSVENMWKITGASTLVMTSKEHDRMVSVTSHLPHIMAFALTLTVEQLNRKDKRAAQLVAGSFKDTTRIADSSSGDWAAICNKNREALIKSVDEYIKNLTLIRNKLDDKNSLEKIFSEAKAARRKILNK